MLWINISADKSNILCRHIYVTDIGMQKRLGFSPVTQMSFRPKDCLTPNVDQTERVTILIQWFKDSEQTATREKSPAQ